MEDELPLEVQDTQACEEIVHAIGMINLWIRDKGYIQLALRSGQYKDIFAFEVKEGEYLGRDSMTMRPKFKFIEDDDIRDSLPTIGYVAGLEYLNGFQKVEYWNKKKMLNHADKYSKAFSAVTYNKIISGEIPASDLWKAAYSSFWYKNFDQMALKTMLRQIISKWGMMSPEMQQAFESDDVAFDTVDGDITPIEYTVDETDEETEKTAETGAGELKEADAEQLSLDDLD